MKGYLLKEQNIRIGEDTFIESYSSENNFAVMFEDDTDTGYFYGAEHHISGELRILDMLHIYDVQSIAEAEKEATLAIIWSTDWLKCALVINSYCHAVFDFANRGGYNRNQFPPPNDVWTMHERKLTDDMVAAFFS